MGTENLLISVVYSLIMILICYWEFTDAEDDLIWREIVVPIDPQEFTDAEGDLISLPRYEKRL